MSDDNATLKCVECNRTKKLHLFYKRGTKRGYTKECKSCYKKGEAYANALERRYLKGFGITLAEYENLLDEQGGRCFICRKRPGRRRLAVDHDHERERTGTMRGSVRGLLCGKCNEFLGHLGDNPDLGRNLIEYLERPSWLDRMKGTGLQ